MPDVSTFSYISTSEIITLLYTLSLKIVVIPFGRRLTFWVIMGSNPRVFSKVHTNN